jgi:hypothetical protein
VSAAFGSWAAARAAAAAGANTDDVAAIVGHSINVQAEHYRQALRRSSELIRAAIG